MSDMVSIIAIVILVIFCAGTPDLLDAIIQYVQSQSKVCP